MNKENFKEQVKKAKIWAKNNLAGKKVYHKEIGAEIIFTKEGIKHAISAKNYYLKVKLIYYAENLLENSKILSKEKDKKNRPDIKNIYRLINTFQYKKRKYLIYIIIRETKKGYIYYDHGLIKK